MGQCCKGFRTDNITTMLTDKPLDTHSLLRHLILYTNHRNTLPCRRIESPAVLLLLPELRQGMFFLQMSTWAYAPGAENEYGITGLPADLSIDVPIFTSRTNSGLDGSECALAHIENGKISFNGKGQAGESKQYLYRGFMKFFYVREPANDQGNNEASD